ncbi:MAG: FAD-linked oxidase C-terminal domain-containing protein [Solirubrobacterales bacterium]
MRLVRDCRSLPDPLGSNSATYVVAQCSADTDVTEQLTAAVEALAPEPAVVAATDTLGRESLWAYRELLNESIRAQGVPHKLDVGLPLRVIPEFDRELRARVGAAYPDASLYLYGHLGDGNFHVNLVGPDPDDEGLDELVLRCAADHGGTISAEHGIGRVKPRYLALCRDEADIRAMRSLKEALDPAGLMAPGRVLP